jgi:hypothetical protein
MRLRQGYQYRLITHPPTPNGAPAVDDGKDRRRRGWQPVPRRALGAVEQYARRDWPEPAVSRGLE